jgi:hypothetical protein
LLLFIRIPFTGILAHWSNHSFGILFEMQPTVFNKPPRRGFIALVPIIDSGVLLGPLVEGSRLEISARQRIQIS